MRFQDVEFSHDELMAFRSAFEGTPLERILHDVVQNIKDAAKIELQKSSINVEGVRLQQGIVQGLDRFKDIVFNILTFNEEEFLQLQMEREAESNDSEEAEHAGRFDW